jgi:hypothetical protein
VSKNQIDIVAILIILFIMFLGSFVRLTHIWTGYFPLNDGGLFYVMTSELIENNYRLPEFSSYNSLNIPFAYPPFPLYLAALIMDLGDIDGLMVVRFLPVLISLSTIPIFFLLSRDITSSETQALFSTVAFAFVPRSFIWLIMGGGLTRAPGYLFALLALWQVYLVFKRGDRKYILLAILFSSLTILSHPEAAFSVLLSALVFFMVLERDWQGLRKSLLVVLGVALLTSPWWLTVFSRHGLSPLLSSIVSTSASLISRIISPWVAILTFDFTEEIWVKVFAFLGLLGLLRCISSKRFILPIWLIVFLFFNTRGHLSYTVIPLCIMAGIGTELILNSLSRFAEIIIESDNAKNNYLNVIMNNTATKLAFGFILIHGLASAYAYPFVHSSIVSPLPVLGAGERQAMTWIRENTNQADTFISISEQPWWLDPTSEWFPALTKRQNLITVQGTEWLSGGVFHDRWKAYDNLMKCSYQESDCITAWHLENDADFTHVYVKKINSTSALRNSLGSSQDFMVIYENDQAAVYQYIAASGQGFSN